MNLTLIWLLQLLIVLNIDIMKLKIVELHNTRKETGLIMRWTVHDEVDGEVPNEESSKKVEEVLNAQSLSGLTVPILWEVGTGPNWAEAKE